MKSIVTLLLLLLTVGRIEAVGPNTGSLPEGFVKLEFDSLSVRNVEPSSWTLSISDDYTSVTRDDVTIVLSDFILKDNEEIIGFTWTIEGASSDSFTVKHGTTVALYSNTFVTSDRRGVSNAVWSIIPLSNDNEDAPIEDTPGEGTPVEDTPVADIPVEETPVEDVPAEEMPIEDIPIEDAPVQDVPIEEELVQETPVEETPVEETPVEETPVEDTVVDEMPVEETLVEETLTEETPIQTEDEDGDLLGEFNDGEENEDDVSEIKVIHENKVEEDDDANLEITNENDDVQPEDKIEDDNSILGEGDESLPETGDFNSSAVGLASLLFGLLLIKKTNKKS